MHVISEFTHDSIFVGEDGPTHQPVEHLMAYRAIPNLLVIRPADANEAVVASKIAFDHNRPSLVLLTRQGLPVLDRNIYPAPCSIEKGGYVMCDHDSPDIMILATGSEVWIALEVVKICEGYAYAAFLDVYNKIKNRSSSIRPEAILEKLIKESSKKS